MQKLSELEDANASKNNKKREKNAQCNEPLIVNSCQPRKKYTATNKSKAKQSKNDATACHAAQKTQSETKMTRTRVR